MDVPVKVAMDRVFLRQTSPDIGLSPNVSRTRIATNDQPNAIQIQACKPFAAVVVPDIPMQSAVES